jgi:predicted transcriptional regulator
MFSWFFGKRIEKLEEKTEKSFSSVKNDMDAVGKWIKHLDSKDKQLFDVLNSLNGEIASLRDELESLREGIALMEEEQEDKQLSKKTAVYDKQTDVEAVEEAVQTPVQTADFFEILKSLSSNERLLIFTLLNADMKLSYEDLALMLGKEKSTIRGQVNSIRQKSEGLINEVSERNGKKRVYLPDEIKEKMAKYAKVRVTDKKKVRVNKKKEAEYV